MNVNGKALQIWNSILHWTWTKSLLYWLIISAGTMAECMFLLASLWMSINSSVHGFMTLFIREETTIHISELATTAYVALPECILGLAFVITIGHVRVWLYDKSNKTALLWSSLYGVPTLIFLVLSLITLGCSVTSTDFRLPEYLIVTRAIAGYVFGFVAFLYSRLGIPQETERLKQRDDTIADLTDQVATLNTAIETVNQHVKRLENTMNDQAQMLTFLQENLSNKTNEVVTLTKILADKTLELETQASQLTETKNHQRRLIEELQKAEGTALQAYSTECQQWLRSGVKTVSIDAIVKYTGHKKAKILAAKLQASPRNANLILVSSLIEWLEKTPAPVNKERDTDTLPPVTTRSNITELRTVNA